MGIKNLFIFFNGIFKLAKAEFSFVYEDSDQPSTYVFIVPKYIYCLI